MTTSFNSNKLHPDDKDWIEEVNDDFDNLITNWIIDYKNGSLLKEDIIKVTEKVAKLRNDENLVKMISQRM